MNRKLSLNKEVIAQLNDDSMHRIEGGVTYTISCTCGGIACTNTAQCTGSQCRTQFACDDVVEVKKDTFMD
jgi:natural product precursor